MKKCIALFAAALLAGAASAVTVNWAVGSPTFAGTTGGQWLGVALISGTVTDYNSVGFTYIVDDTTGSGTLTFTTPSEGILASSLTRFNAGDSNISGSFADVNWSSEMGNLTVLFIAPYQYGNQGWKGALSYASFDVSQLNVEDWVNITVETITLNGGVGSSPNAATGTDIVPEPTALALLALGVAGLALRRRVA